MAGAVDLPVSCRLNEGSDAPPGPAHAVTTIKGRVTAMPSGLTADIDRAFRGG